MTQSFSLIFQLPRAGSVVAALLIALSLLTGGCQKAKRDNSLTISQAIADKKTKTDNLRKAMRYLSQMTPLNSQNMTKEVQLALNTWLKSADFSKLAYSPSRMLRDMPADQLEFVGCATPAELLFSESDIDYLYEQQMLQGLSQWIVDFPVRDRLFEKIVADKQSSLDPQVARQLSDAYKLFDWTVRNIVLEDEASSSVEQKFSDPRDPISDTGIGYGYLPWQTLLFSRGDFIERSRVFMGLARQRGIDTCWISVGAPQGTAGQMFCVGVLIGEEVLLFDPKLGMPVLEPDEVRFASLKDALDNPRVLRRLDLPGQFDYAFDSESLVSIQFLLDAVPTALSARMKLLEQSLLGEERMMLYSDVDAIADRLNGIYPDAIVSAWRTPLLAQIQAESVKQRLTETSPFTMQYMARHGVWLMATPASEGRFAHLAGSFENTMEKDGALSIYMQTRVDDESIGKLSYDPDVQKSLGVSKQPGEPQEQFEVRIRQSQYLFGQSKVDAAFLLAQLHFDRGNFEAAESWLRKRVVDDERSVNWHAAGHYLLGRVYEHLGELEKAEQEYSFEPSAQEAGNRLRLRYVKRQ